MEVLSSLVVLLLLVADVAEAPPGRVALEVEVESLFERAFSLREVLVVDVFVPAERVGVRVLRVELDGASEELECLLVLLLEGEAVAHCDPGFWGIYALLQGLVGQVAQVHVFLQVPQAAGVVLHSLEPVRLHLVRLLVVLCGFAVFNHLHVGSADGCQHPPCVEVVLRQLLELVDGLQAVVHAEVVVALAELAQQRHQI